MIMRSCRRPKKVSFPLPDRRAPGLCRAEKTDILLRSEQERNNGEGAEPRPRLLPKPEEVSSQR